MKKKRKKRTQRQTLTSKIDRAWSNAVRERDKWTCQWCFKKVFGKQAHAHHIITKGSTNKYGRWDLINGVTLCSACHRFRIGKDTYDYVQWLDSYLTEKDTTYVELRSMYNKPVKLTIEDLEYLLSKLEGKDG